MAVAPSIVLLSKVRGAGFCIRAICMAMVEAPERRALLFEFFQSARATAFGSTPR